MKTAFLQHVHLICSKLQPMIDFWVNGLGATFVEYRQFGDAAGAVLDCNSETKLYLKELPCTPQPQPAIHAGTEHLAMLVDNLDALLAHIRTLPGCRVSKEPFTAGGFHCAFITGPEGVLVEVMEKMK